MSHWIEKTTIYHIYPLGFCGCEDNRSEFSPEKAPTGRILKIIDWIPHLKEMNFNAVLFNPLFESVRHGYDTTDFFKLDARLGSNEDFGKVCAALRENGIKVILDGVFNHVGRDFPQFREMLENRENSRYKDWFVNVNFGGNNAFNDGLWYEGWQNHYELVKLNLWNPEVRDYLFSAAEFWIREWGIDGLRFDAADCLTNDFIKAMHSFTRSKKPDFWLMGEIIHGNYNNWANAEMFDCVTNYQCHKGLWSSHNDRNYYEIASSFEQQNNQYHGIYMYNFLDNHDVTRIISQLKNPEHIYNCYTMLYTMFGVPSVYYGGEFGIPGVKGSSADADKPLRPNLDIEAVKSENPKLQAHIKRLGEIRFKIPFISNGAYYKEYLNNRSYAYRRQLDDRYAYVAFNIEDGDHTFVIKSTTEYWVDCLTGTKYKTWDGEVKVTLPPDTAAILIEEWAYNNAGLSPIDGETTAPAVETVGADTIRPQITNQPEPVQNAAPVPVQTAPASVQPAPVQSAPAPVQPAPVPVQPAPAIKIRRANVSDIHALTHLFVDYQRLFGETNPIFDNIEAFLRDKMGSAGYTLFFAEKDGKPVGFAGLYPIYSSVTLRPEWLLNDLFVSGNYRRQGVGTALINELKSQFSGNSQGIILVTASGNNAAKAFYEANGFESGGNEFLRLRF
ncbi:MAG: GNAT family N-acetyltransferase [Ruminococcus sp.]|jgi:glycosidase/GNAT superfamily N-acetyltransferase|nr:GNAT family N-acetyltransferase [Ruminococcus sp.]